MRQIKFRAWLVTETKMVGWSPTFFSDMSPVTRYSSDFPSADGDVMLMQFTGLKDNSGREIYEGDIVRDIDSFTGVVTWEDEEGMWYVKDGSSNSDLRDCIISAEVVGNIYETPELA